MRTIHTLTISAVTVLGLVCFGMTGLAQAGQTFGGGREMGHGPVVTSAGAAKGVNYDKGHDWDKNWHQEWNRNSYLFGYSSYCFPVAQYPCDSIYGMSAYPTSVVFATYQPVYCYDCFRSYEHYNSWHHEHPVSSGPTTASSHRNSENLGSASHRTSGKGHR